MVRLPGLPSDGVLLSPPCRRYYARLRLPRGRKRPGPRRASPVPRRTLPAFHVPYAGGFLTAALPRASPRPWPSPLPCGLGSLLIPLPGCVTTPQTSLHATDGRVACPPREDVVSGLRRRDFARRRRSATRRLGPYRDRTCTGQLNAASLVTHGIRTPACSRGRGTLPLEHWQSVSSLRHDKAEAGGTPALPGQSVFRFSVL
jgi:hypothetical protein